ncbi:unnamed protein product [Brassica rapa]|uniref:Uncharacterized protein n=1 Tax=Brassica campestris TaxID=3711 RepID=A0A8D9HK17_BRACM|nr:unnamed protein product [Brassica rapa]
MYLLYTFMQMGRLVRVLRGEWSKSEEGFWRFDGDPGDMEQYVLVKQNEPINSLIGLVREEFMLTPHTPLLLTYQLPPWMLMPDGPRAAPLNIVCSGDVEMMMSVHEWTSEVNLCVTYGAEAVARYGFLCRTPFRFGQRSYLGHGVSEEQHLAAINGLIGRDPFVCSETVMREIFREDEMVILYRVSFEVEKARRSLDLNAHPPPEEVVVDMSMSDDGVVPEVGRRGNAQQHIGRSNEMEGLETARIGSPVGPLNPSPSIFRQASADDGFPREHQTYIPNWGEVGVGPGFWENMLGEGYVLPSSSGMNVRANVNVNSVGEGLNISVASPPARPTYIVDIEGSSTGSSSDAAVNKNAGLAPRECGVRETNEMPNVHIIDEDPLPAYGRAEPENMVYEVPVINVVEDDTSRIDIEDTSSEIAGGNGGFEPLP